MTGDRAAALPRHLSPTRTGLAILLAAYAIPAHADDWPLPPCPRPSVQIADDAIMRDHDASDRMQLARMGGEAPQMSLNRAEAAALLLEDETAVVEARRYLGRAQLEHARDAWTLIGVVDFRRGRYGDAARALEQALNHPATAATDNATEATGLRNMLRMAQALAGEPAPQWPASGRGVLPIAADAAGLSRGHVQIDGHRQHAVLDTGANLSVVVRSQADLLGLRLIEGEVSIASPVSPQTPARLAVADHLAIGGAVFRNVVFLVLPDEALTFADGAYRIQTIIGFPVLGRLGRLEFSKAGAGQTLRFESRADARRANEVNLVPDGKTPKLLACIGTPARPLQLAIDTGAGETSLLPRFAADFPSATAGATQVTERIGGAGGTVEQDNQILPALEFRIGSKVVRLSNISLGSETLNQPVDHGRLGQDALRHSYVLDFQAMRLEIMPPD